MNLSSLPHAQERYARDGVRDQRSVLANSSTALCERDCVERCAVHGVLAETCADFRARVLRVDHAQFALPEPS